PAAPCRSHPRALPPSITRRSTSPGLGNCADLRIGPGGCQPTPDRAKRLPHWELPVGAATCPGGASGALPIRALGLPRRPRQSVAPLGTERRSATRVPVAPAER